MNNDELCFTPATELAAAIRAKKLSPVEITEAVLERMERVNPKINAFCTPTPDIARREAKQAEADVMGGKSLGPLHGVPYSIKDLVITKGVKTMRGSKIYEKFVPDEDAIVVERLRGAGGVFLGKTSSPEFGWKGVTDSPVTGITRNPWNLERTPGGSSGGASAQVAAGLGPLALGTDGGGSIRIPSAFAGIYGLKPSYGRVPVYPASGHDMLSHAGPMTRTVGDGALMLSVLAGPDERDRYSLEGEPADYVGLLNKGVKGLKVAWSPDLGYAHVQPEVADLAGKAARAFEELGCTVEEIDPGFGDPTSFFDVFWRGSSAGVMAEYLPKWEAQMDPGYVEIIKGGMEVSAEEFVKAQIARHQYWDKVQRFFANYDLLLTPSLAVTAFEVGLVRPPGTESNQDYWLNWTPFSYPFNLTGNPAATVPAGFSGEGLPVGLQIVGRRFADLTVLQASAAFEQARPWADKRPQL